MRAALTNFSRLFGVSLGQKLDHLLHNQWDSMVELQQVQIDLLHVLSGRKRGPAPS